uniref:Uncharacterized protein n=1 Tax=Oryza brachyantha TaxID=4533 RepID=J3MEQ5_ORYBR
MIKKNSSESFNKTVLPVKRTFFLIRLYYTLTMHQHHSHTARSITYAVNAAHARLDRCLRGSRRRRAAVVYRVGPAGHHPVSGDAI